MAEQYTVKEGETLLAIAHQHGFATVDPLLERNPSLSAEVRENYDVLRPGMTLIIPELACRLHPVALDNKHVFKVTRQRKDLLLSFQMPDGSPLKTAVTAELRADKRQFALESEGLNQWRCKNWPAKVKEADLTISFEYTTMKHGEPELKQGEKRTWREPVIKLLIGGLNPLDGDETEKGHAAQRLLANLGFYSAPSDGNLDSEKSQSALRKFQSLHGLEVTGRLTPATAERLVSESHLKSKVAGSAQSGLGQAFNTALPIGDEAASIPCEILPWDDYVEPTDSDQQHHTPCGGIKKRFFPSTVYVAPTDEGSQLNVNVIRMKARRFVFLDSGRWLKKSRDFGVIWGRHVYRCEYVPSGDGTPIPDGARDGLDTDFFVGMRNPRRASGPSYEDMMRKLDPPPGWPFHKSAHLSGALRSEVPPAPEPAAETVKVLERATATWAPESEFDWQQLIIVIPDTHLMTHEIGRIWRKKFELDPELDLLRFAETVSGIAALKGKVHVIQIGDSYDLWIGYEPRLWKENQTVRMELIERKEDVKWSCGRKQCKGHTSTSSPPCPGPPREFWCGRVEPPCEGHDSVDEPHCADRIDQPLAHQIAHLRGAMREQRLTRWSCGRAWPYCKGEHFSPYDFCTDETDNPGMFWKCRRIEPTCAGHSMEEVARIANEHRTRISRHMLRCPDVTDTMGKIGEWIREIQGYNGRWVRPALEARAHLPYGYTIKELGEKLSDAGTAVWLNPAEVALRLLAKECRLTYLYGNHDNYLINHRLTDRCGIPMRKAVIEIERLFLEHAHRMEAQLKILPSPTTDELKDIGLVAGPAGVELRLSLASKTSPFPSNQDGAVTGYESAMGVFRNRKRMLAMKQSPGGPPPSPVVQDPIDKVAEVLGNAPLLKKENVEPSERGGEFLEDVADTGARMLQQPQYWRQFARVWLGRTWAKTEVKEKSPHIFVIGHTHNPKLSYIDLFLTLELPALKAPGE